MADWKDNKGLGPWDFTPSNDKWGYLNNPLWSGQQDAIDFCENLDLPLDLSNQHKPCGHWHKAEVSEEVFPAGRWVAAMQQPGTPYIYVYDILQKAVIQIDTSEIPVFVSGRLELDSAYALDYDMGRGNPGGQRGGYCMNKDGTRIWYLFTDSSGDRSDAEFIEVDISGYQMEKVGSTLFPNLVPSEALPSSNNERINDGCSDDIHTYWCTNLVAGRIIKIRNDDHVIVDDHYFDYLIEECGIGVSDEAIATIDFDGGTGKLHWVYCRDHVLCIPSYNACRHLIQASTDLVEDTDSVFCGSGYIAPQWQNMIRVCSGYVLHHQAYYFGGPLMQIPDGVIISQDMLQNILGVKNGKIFTLMHIYNLAHPGFLYCINYSDMSEMSKLDVSYYAGQKHPPGSYDWDWTSVSAMNQQTGVMAIFRYHNLEERNYVGCFDASPSLGFLCDVPLHFIRHSNEREILDEPQSWPLEGFIAPPIPSTDPPVEVIVPPGESPGPGEVPYVPPPPPPDDVPDDGVTLLQSGFMDYFNVGPGQALFFKIEATVSDCIYPIQISNTSQSQEPHTVHLLIKRGSKPTIADFNLTVAAGSSIYDCTLGLWLPAKPSGAEELYWKYNVGSQAEFVEINEPRASDTYYIMLYNNGSRSVRNQRLGVSYP